MTGAAGIKLDCSDFGQFSIFIQINIILFKSEIGIFFLIGEKLTHCNKHSMSRQILIPLSISCHGVQEKSCNTTSMNL